MKSFVAFLKKEWMDLIRSGRLLVLVILFVVFGIMNPAIAKVTPWLMEMMADSLAETGLIMTEVHVDAMTSWTQFFKNIPMGLIAFVLIQSSLFSKEYQSGTLVLVLTKGMARYKVIVAKFSVMIFLWTFCYWLCYGITYGYNAYFWDNSVANVLVPTAINWWLFGVWTISLIVLFSAFVRNNIGVLIGTGGTVLAAYLIGLLPKVKEYSPTMLMNTAGLLAGAEELATYSKTIGVTLILCVAAVGVSIPIMNKRELL
ncbi:MAG: ABC transporter permease subunit [Tyzzerella sp.]|nr:ABC transporter permease subunit [Tyzzerella sp.]